jgi:hypothetical protein
MNQLYVLGARQKKLRLKKEDEWNLYEEALIVEIDTQTGTARNRIKYCTPPDARSSDNASHIFKASTISGNILYACTSTEVLLFKLPEFEQIGYVSLPCFNDLHHVTPSSDGNLMVASTGLDMVVKFNKRGDILKIWPVLGGDPWSRFSPEVDYRKVDSTKPHQSHPNFIFELNGEPWVTRFRQRDAICLNHPEHSIDIAVQTPHDGLVCGNRIYFTTVDGRLVIANAGTHQVDRVIDLKEIGGTNDLLGWCRGLLPVDDRRIWVAFTRVRKTQFTENVLWVKKVFQEGMGEKPTHIALYDIVEGRCLAEIDMEPHGLNVIFSILPAFEGSARSQSHTDAQD